MKKYIDFFSICAELYFLMTSSEELRIQSLLLNIVWLVKFYAALVHYLGTFVTQNGWSIILKLLKHSPFILKIVPVSSDIELSVKVEKKSYLPKSSRKNNEINELWAMCLLSTYSYLKWANNHDYLKCVYYSNFVPWFM